MAGNENRKRPEEIEKDLESTRAAMDETLDAISRKFTPGDWLEQSVRYVAAGSREYAGYLERGVRRNPLPLALVGIGLSWLALSGSKRASRPAAPHEPSPYAGEESTMEDRYEQMKKETGRTGGRLRERFGRYSEKWGSRSGHFRHSAGERRSRISEAAGQRTARLRSRLDTIMEEQPLVMGALVFSVGAALGAILPVTHRERRLMGEKREEMLAKAREVGREQVEHAQEAAREVGEAARQEMHRQMGDTGHEEEKSREKEPAL